MIKTVWINAHFQKKGLWEEYEEHTGETKSGFFGEKAVTVKKKRWVELNEYRDDYIDGVRLSRDTEKALNQLESEGFDILNITPVMSGQYSWTKYGTSGPNSGAAPTCASWGYSVTEGLMVTAKKR